MMCFVVINSVIVNLFFFFFLNVFGSVCASDMRCYNVAQAV